MFPKRRGQPTTPLTTSRDRHSVISCQYGCGCRSASNNVRKYEKLTHFVCSTCADRRVLGPSARTTHRAHREYLESFPLGDQPYFQKFLPLPMSQVHDSLCREFSINPEISPMFHHMMNAGLTLLRHDTAIPASIRQAFGADYDPPKIMTASPWTDKLTNMSYDELWATVMGELIQNRAVSQDRPSGPH